LTVETSADGMSYAGSRSGDGTVWCSHQQFRSLLSFGLAMRRSNLSRPVLSRPMSAGTVALGLNLEGFQAMSDYGLGH